MLYLPLPADVSKEELLLPSDDLEDRLHGLAVGALMSVRSAPPATPQEQLDAIVIFVDHEGQPILPDLELARSSTPRDGEAQERSELTFTFNSPSYPWTPQEQAVLTTQLSTFYLEAQAIYGAPAFSIAVNVRRDPTITFSGLYYPSLNEMVLRNGSSPDNVCHEMIHAFRDDNVIHSASFEEGMTRAAEVEVFNRLAAYQHPFDENHSYTLDVYYEDLNRRAIGSQGGNFFAGYVSALLRYQLAGYAWAKVYLENNGFFSNLNAALYARALSDPDVLGNENKLIRLVAAVQASVEGLAFGAWYLNQAVLNTHPPSGAFLYHRINEFTVDRFSRFAGGSESMQGNAPIQWAVYDYLGGALDSGAATTSSLGTASFIPAIPANYTGQIRVQLTGDTADGPISDSALRSWGNEEGVFGIVPDSLTGSLTITPLDGQAAPSTVHVTNGSFSVGSLATVRGRFLAEFSGVAGESFAKRFTKDASRYFLLMGKIADPCVGPEIQVIRSGSQVIVSWTSQAVSVYDVVRGSLATLRSSGGNFTQALNAVSPASDVCMSNDTTGLWVSDPTAPVVPGNSEFYLVRTLDCGGQGTYDSGAPSQTGSRDGEIALAVGACP